MKYLLDTHYLIWSIIDPDKIDKKRKKILLDVNSYKYISQISFWEISIKYSLGKLELKGITPEELPEAAIKSGFQILELETKILASSYKLPKNPNHKDPFDRLIIWECICNDFILLTADDKVKEYKENGLKIV